MEPMLRRSALSLCLLPVSGLVEGHPAKIHPRFGEAADIQPPNSQSQVYEILKAEREQNIKDAARLVN